MYHRYSINKFIIRQVWVRWLGYFSPIFSKHPPRSRSLCCSFFVSVFIHIFPLFSVGGLLLLLPDACVRLYAVAALWNKKSTLNAWRCGAHITHRKCLPSSFCLFDFLLFPPIFFLFLLPFFCYHAIYNDRGSCTVRFLCAVLCVYEATISATELYIHLLCTSRRENGMYMWVRGYRWLTRRLYVPWHGNALCVCYTYIY